MKLAGSSLVSSLLALATVAGCATAVAPGPDDEVDEDGAPSRATVGNGRAAQVDPPKPPPQPGCYAVLARLPNAAGCAVRLDVRIGCDPTTQVHTWARLGVFVDGDKGGEAIDVEYRCGTSLSHVFEIPCGEHTVVGAGSFDHPVTAEDVHCLSQ